MQKRVLLAVLMLTVSALACMQRIPDWERQQEQGALTPPINNETKYLCVIPLEPEIGVLASSGEYSEFLRGGTRMIDSGRRWAITNKYAVVYYKGYALNIRLDYVEEC